MIKDLEYNLKEMKGIKTVSYETYQIEYIYLSNTNLKAFNDGTDSQHSSLWHHDASVLFVISNLILPTYITCLSSGMTMINIFKHLNMRICV